MKSRVLNEVLRKRRLDVDFTQQDLSSMSGVNISIIKALETGRSDTTYENISKLCEALKIPISEVYLEDFRETKVITVANNKGGSGKTSVVASLGYCLSEINENRVLLIDGDMQMNLSYSYNVERNDRLNLYEAIIQESPLTEYIVNTEFQNIDIIISDFNMATIEMILFTKTLRETIFKRILQPVIDMGTYDYIIIDTNPTLGILNFNILNASDYIIVPVEMSAFGILGLEILTKFIRQAQDINQNLAIAGVLRTKVDKRELITTEAENVLIDVFGNKIFDTYIPIDTNVKKSQWEQIPLNVFSENSRANKQYQNLAKEVSRIVK
ncbi:AAA family ATPase [Anoxynatronum sibiricum]|uniref:AAA family ATPase n=1 Tax=Anoxynatronum sibiricum TaxID=210623 RepID=A0ABU9W065_9CLOT